MPSAKRSINGDSDNSIRQSTNTTEEAFPITGQTTDTNTAQGIAEFYNSLAPDYDAMTNFEQRFNAEEPVLRALLERYSIKQALDAGCGTGFHSLLLARLGTSVTAIDVSREMLSVLRKNAAKHNLPLRAFRSEFRNVVRHCAQEFDAVFCLGNSLAHLLSEEEVVHALTAFRDVLKPQGVAIIQMLNYERILAERETILSKKEIGNTTFVRYYDFGEELLRFNIMKIEKNDDSTEQSLISVPLRPIRKDELVQHLTEAGFSDVHCFGDLNMHPFDWLSSKDLVVVARKTQS